MAKLELEDVYWFRCDSKCTFEGTFFPPSEGEDGVGEYFQFPGSMLFDVPQHFTAVKAGNLPGTDKTVLIGSDSKAQALRDAYFARFLPINRVDTGDSIEVRAAKTAQLKANFMAYGQADNPDGTPATPASVQGGVNTAEQALADENAALKAQLAALEASKPVVPDAVPAAVEEAPVVPEAAPENGGT